MTHPSSDELFAGLDAGLISIRDEIRRERALLDTRLAELKSLTSIARMKEDAAAVIREHVPLLTPPRLTVSPEAQGRPVETWVLVVSDLQYGQKTDLQASGGVFEQSSAVATQQFRELWRRFEELWLVASHSVYVERVVVKFLGDMHDGDDMRPGHAAKTDAPVMVQCIEVNDLEAWLLNQLLTIVPMVEVHNIGGNHDRNSQRPGTAGLGIQSMVNTYAWLGGEILRRRFEAAINEGRLTIKNWESWFGTAWVCGKRFVFEHGASFKSSTGSYGGVSYYSIANAGAGYQRMLDGADFVIMGHHHQPMILPMRGGWGWLVVNGAFPPSTEFVQSNFKGLGRPQQWLLKMNQEKGMVGAEPIYLETEHMIMPGDFWTRLEGASPNSK